MTPPGYMCEFILISNTKLRVTKVIIIYKARITADADSKTIIKTLNEHNHGVNQQKVESQQLRVRVRKASNITARPSKIIRTELQVIVEGILRTSLRIPATSIPSKQTSYYCMLFRLPRNDTFHLVGTKPIIDNKDITHHILLFGCNEQEGQIIPSEETYECGMLAHRQCVNIIGTWTVGSDGDCFHNSTGFKIGSSGFQTAALQIHWNNRNRIPNMTDSSGLELFYTPNLRQYEAGMFAVGQEYLNIPPRVPNISFRSSCSSACTEVMFPKGVFITRAVNHMHYKGIQQNIEIYRGNKKIRDITHEEEYTYDKPVFYQFDPPIKIRPGDEIRTTCTYSSLSSNETIFFGEGTSDEMCYGFITYYPAQNIALPYCTTWKTVEKCKRYMPQFGGIIDGCRWKDFLSGGNEYIGFMMIELAMHCDTTCSSNCTEKVRNLREHECLSGDLGDFMIFKLQRKYPSISLIKDCFRENKSDNHCKLASDFHWQELEPERKLELAEGSCTCGGDQTLHRLIKAILLERNIFIA
ncbi:DBH-like monooxygenase protein 1 [Mytilus trossulus]|uniref:DBH-like monooxygenase protein 1 n=1 Tax=Mytilus trossulus TaxID=6551 RepID=UPI003005221E